MEFHNSFGKREDKKTLEPQELIGILFSNLGPLWLPTKEAQDYELIVIISKSLLWLFYDKYR